MIVQNIITRKSYEIPLLVGSGKIPLPDKNCGIHSISMNRMATKLVTGAQNPNSVGFYRVPSLEPIAIGEVSIQYLDLSNLKKIDGGLNFV